MWYGFLTIACPIVSYSDFRPIDVRICYDLRGLWNGSDWGWRLELKPTEVLLFGNPKLDTPQMQTNRHVAIDLPMRLLVWEDDAGKVLIGYTPPSTLKKRYKLDGLGEILKTLAGALDAFTNAAANRPRARATMRTAVSAGC